ncbi:ion transporter [Solitalea canadensis]|uniref:Kef-type K+ ransport system, predicted NAD-binding component n=1 Tax=Solitalea canadensis (strain ATCC 29591 / DSM 3403 / JCM 21819 / LMG 8368 / NBRC 15130 / NCIMB 12057 / USAM 9D) TaxID=929556 RepID=H8KRK9_SOLCM|nr:ion transporter [Solitalea canadensis]AFD07590.1 Kef-type K+ ransport system, predicted NAD-binding component [Solitalea canadensis DSM 3403]
MLPENKRTLKNWQYELHEIIYESGTFKGKLFDVCLLIAICLSVVVVMLDSVPGIHQKYGNLLYSFEWFFTILFTIEYILRLICIRKPMAYAVSSIGIIDLVAIVPTYISFFVVGSQYLLVVRALRLLRIFRIFKLWHFMDESRFLISAIYASLRKISIFMLFVIILTIIIGSLMYLIEGGENGFTSIPQSIYWAVVTITTVGYGDISPATAVGKLLATMLMLCGYAIIAVPTGIVTTEMAFRNRNKLGEKRVCGNCNKEGHEVDAKYCKFCGSEL